MKRNGKYFCNSGRKYLTSLEADAQAVVEGCQSGGTRRFLDGSEGDTVTALKFRGIFAT